ncbi:MAG TPA: CNNM domain-containing protein [Candidatus Saccharimonadales bacterium]|nr:CNNM domain-containing protein [Candidatus Saccharimonadales bacterium]
MHVAIITVEVLLLVLFSAVCSGLNIGLMSLEVADLRRKAKLGNTDAKRVLPLRKNSHLSLAAILLCNVAAVSATSLVLESAVYGLIAGTISTLLIVIFGEIMPQALFNRHALHYCARLSPLLRTMMYVTYPVSKPLQLLLDRLFGEEVAALQSRHELGIMMTEHLGDTNSELDDDEIEIMRGALTLSEKRVRDIMTPIRSVFWLSPEDVIDARRIDDIKERGWSRIPILNKQHTVCFGLLLMKDLVDIDFDREAMPVHELPLYPVQVVGSMTALDTLFRKFITGGAHLIPVEKDDKMVGIATIEDLLEEIVGHEIEDETDRSRRLNKTRIRGIRSRSRKKG